MNGPACPGFVGVMAKGTVTQNNKPAQGYLALTIHAPEVARRARPGQFVMVRGWGTHSPLLPRPFSFHRLYPSVGLFQILVRVVGEATTLMSGWVTGHELQLLGPLGNGFPLTAGGRAAIVARGTGVAPMVALAEALGALGVSTRAYLSASNRASLVGFASLSQVAESVETTTDDGSQGPPGLVTRFFERDLERLSFDVVYTCGSKRLARATRRLQETHGFRAYISLEATLACGVGSCRGCVIPVRDAQGRETYQRVCREGPVFPLHGVNLE